MRPRMKKGAAAVIARNGSSAAAMAQPSASSQASTTAGTITATKAGATVWAKKYSTFSTSWVAMAVRSPVRRRSR